MPRLATRPVKELLEALLGRDVEVAVAAPVDPTAVPGPTTAVYVDPRTRMTAVVLVDLPLTAYLGAALGLVPKAAADAEIDDGAVGEALLESTAEVLNVLAALLTEELGVHQRLYRTYAAGEPRPADVHTLAATLGSRLDLLLDVKGYGVGGMSIVAVPAP